MRSSDLYEWSYPSVARASAEENCRRVDVAIFLYAACAVLYVLALRLFPLSVAGPVFMTTGVFASALLGVLYFGEALSVARTIGVLLCLSGIVLLSR